MFYFIFFDLLFLFCFQFFYLNNIFGLYDINDDESNGVSFCFVKFQAGELRLLEFMFEEEKRMWVKDRQKKDNYNMSKWWIQNLLGVVFVLLVGEGYK